MRASILQLLKVKVPMVCPVTAVPGPGREVLELLILEIIFSLLNMNHLHGSSSNIVTSMWCAWKSTNYVLFGRKINEPYQISLHARALSDDLELERRAVVEP